jgi:hypothetical protein
MVYIVYTSTLINLVCASRRFGYLFEFNRRQLTGLHLDFLNTWQHVYFPRFIRKVRFRMMASNLFVGLSTQLLRTIIEARVFQNSVNIHIFPCHTKTMSRVAKI